MLCNRILGTTHHGTYKKVVDVPLLREELSARSIRCIARDGVEIEIDVYEDLQEGDILAETEQNVVTSETESGPAERSDFVIEQTPAVRGVETRRVPLL